MSAKVIPAYAVERPKKGAVTLVLLGRSKRLQLNKRQARQLARLLNAKL